MKYSPFHSVVSHLCSLSGGTTVHRILPINLELSFSERNRGHSFSNGSRLVTPVSRYPFFLLSLAHVAPESELLLFTRTRTLIAVAGQDNKFSWYSTLVAASSARDHRYVTIDRGNTMNFIRNLMILTVLVLSLHNNKCLSAADPISLFSFIRDLVQHNIAGVPIIHEETQWDFDPNVGKQRRIRYEEENGRNGEIAIAKIGMGIGYKGPWGTPV